MTRLQCTLFIIGFTVTALAVGGVESGSGLVAGVVWMIVGLALMALGTPRRL